MGVQKLETPLFFPFVFLLVGIEPFDDFQFLTTVSESLPVFIDQDSHKIPVAVAVPMKARCVSFHSQQPAAFYLCLQDRVVISRSEERRVGKECRFGLWRAS